MTMIPHLLAKVPWDCSVVAGNGHCMLRAPWDSGKGGAALGIGFFLFMVWVGTQIGGPKKPGKK